MVPCDERLLSGVPDSSCWILQFTCCFLSLLLCVVLEMFPIKLFKTNEECKDRAYETCLHVAKLKR
jgi:hypothetical protein